MSSSSSNGDSQQPKVSTQTSIQYIIERLEELLKSLTEAKAKAEEAEAKAKAEEAKAVAKAEEAEAVAKAMAEAVAVALAEAVAKAAKATAEAKQKKETHTQLEKVWKEVDYMIRAFKKLEKFEGDLKEPLKTLRGNVEDIIEDLNRSSSASLNQIERNLKVLRSNITKVKIQIPLQHQASNLISDGSRYLQATVASREAGDLPNLYEAAKILKKASIHREIEDKYNGLEVRLKLCLLCFAIFPEKAEVKKSLLRSWWLGERLAEVLPKEKDKVGRPVSGQKDEMDRVDKILDELVKKRFIEPVKKKSRLPATSYTMHPIIRSLLIRLAKETNFFDYDPKGTPTDFFTVSASKKTCLTKREGHWLPAKQQPKTLQQTSSKKQQQTDSEKQQKEQQKYLDDLHKYLEYLQTVFNINKQFPDLPVEEFSKMRNIGVLYLGRWEKTAERHMEVESTDFMKGLVNMKKLRLFSLQGISGISKLPDSVCKLMNLRMLDLRACHNLEDLPKQLGSLKKLAYLDISECYLIDNMPKQLASLSELRVLKGFVISKNKHSCNLQTLTALQNLKKLTIIVNSSTFSIDDQEKVLCKFAELQKLRITWGAEGVKSEAQPNKPGSNGGKKGNGKRETGKQQDDASKSGAKKALQKLKMQWGACGDQGSSNPIALGAEESPVVKSEAELNKPGSNGGKKGNGKGETRKQQDDASKSGATKALQKLKMPWGACWDQGSSNTVTEKKEENGFEKLEKLDLQCFPSPELPSWLVPGKLTSLNRLYLSGGKLSYLQDTTADKMKWEVKFLRLKYLDGIQISWKDLQSQFPKLKYLERVKCPGITFCPCNANGVWQQKP